MTAFAFPARSRSTDAFWAANAHADARIVEHDRLAVEASFAPPVTTFASCPCGSVFEVRENRIEVTDTEKAAAAEVVADFFGRGPLDDLDTELINRIVAAINQQRETETLEALQDWQELHDYCGGVS